MAKRIGIIGGSFDPIHLGHLIIAQDACEQFALDRVLFAPAFQAPLRSRPTHATPQQRLAMVRAAVEGAPFFEASDLEFHLGEVSYSITTAQELKRQFPDDELFWIIGADQSKQLHDWRDIEKLAELVTFIVFRRPGSNLSLSAELPRNIRLLEARERAIDISSTEIRDRLKSGRLAKYFLPATVFDYIKAENLYR